MAICFCMAFEKSAVKKLLDESGNLSNALKRFEALYWFKKSFNSFENAVFSKNLNFIKRNADGLFSMLSKYKPVFEFENPVNLKWFKGEFSEDLENENNLPLRRYS